MACPSVLIERDSGAPVSPDSRAAGLRTRRAYGKATRPCRPGRAPATALSFRPSEASGGISPLPLSCATAASTCVACCHSERASRVKNLAVGLALAVPCATLARVRLMPWPAAACPGVWGPCPAVRCSLAVAVAVPMNVGRSSLTVRRVPLAACLPRHNPQGDGGPASASPRPPHDRGFQAWAVTASIGPSPRRVPLAAASTRPTHAPSVREVHPPLPAGVQAGALSPGHRPDPLPSNLLVLPARTSSPVGRGKDEPGAAPTLPGLKSRVYTPLTRGKHP